jgi:hypothetical protein
MHDTAYLLGTLVMDIYGGVGSSKLLEVGLRPAGTSLRDRTRPSTDFVGFELDADRVAEGAGYKVASVDDNAFDLVVSTIRLENDHPFWCAFLDLCKKTKDGGYIYFNTFPDDDAGDRQAIWHFSSGSGLALAKWAVSQGQEVSLVESFFVGSAGETAADFVAVFRKGRITRDLPKTFLHKNVPCFNVMTWKSSATLRPVDDLEILRTLKREVGTLGSDLAGRDRELRKQQDAIEQTNKLLANVRDERDYLTARLADSEQRLGPLREELAELEAYLLQLAGQRRAADQLAKDMQEQLAAAHAKLATVKSAHSELEGRANATIRKLEARFDEIATLTSIVRDEENSHALTRGQLDWLRGLAGALRSQPKWWGLMPSEWRRRREMARLKQRGIFDGDAYLRRYPDVAEAGFEPLFHYMQHGLQEGRSRS